MKEQWFYVAVKNPQAPLTRVEPLTFAFGFGEIAEDSTYQNSVIVSIEQPFKILFSAMHQGKVLSGTVIRQVIAKTDRFPGIDISDWAASPEEDGCLVKVDKANSQVKQAILLRRVMALDDFVMRFKTIWLFLAELASNCVLVEFGSCTVVTQVQLFSQLLLAFMVQEIAYCTMIDAGVIKRFSVDQQFLREEVIGPMLAGGFLGAEFMPQFEERQQRYPLRGDRRALAYVARDLSARAAAAADVTYGSSAADLLAQQGIYGTAEETAQELYKQVVKEKRSLSSVAPQSDYGTAVAYAVTVVSTAATRPRAPTPLPTVVRAPALASVIYDLPRELEYAAGQYEELPSVAEAQAPLIDPSVLALLGITSEEDAIYDTSKHVGASIRIIALLCCFLNGEFPVDLQKPGRHIYKIGGFKLGSFLIGSRGEYCLDHDIAREGLQILLAMCIYNCGHTYTKVLLAFREMYKFYCVELDKIPFIIEGCGVIRKCLPQDRVKYVVQEVKQLLMLGCGEEGLPSGFKQDLIVVLSTPVLRDPSKHPAAGLKLKFPQALKGALKMEMQRYLSVELSTVLDQDIKLSFKQISAVSAAGAALL